MKKKLFEEIHKVKFLELYRTRPNVAKCAEELGFSRRTVHRALQLDEAFKLAYHEVQECLNDDLEEKMYENALKGNGFLPRLAYLKAHGRRQKWQDKVQHEHIHDKTKAVNQLFSKIPKK